MKKYIIFLLLTSCYCITILAQSSVIRQSKHEFSIDVGGGLSSLQYKIASGNMSKSLGGMVGIGYRNFINQNISIGVGVEFPLYRNKVSMDSIPISSMATDMDGTVFEFKSRINNYSENQNVMYVNIPLMVQYQSKHKNRFYVATGLKVCFPSKGKYEINGMNVKNSGYYEYENIEYSSPKFMGFGTFENLSKTDTINLKTAFMLSLEAGIKWKLNKENSLYTGVYLDYGLNDILKRDQEVNFIEYNTLLPKNFGINSILTSQYLQDKENIKLVSGKVTPIAIGIKIRWAFEFDILKMK